MKKGSRSPRSASSRSRSITRLAPPAWCCRSSRVRSRASARSASAAARHSRRATSRPSPGSTPATQFKRSEDQRPPPRPDRHRAWSRPPKSSSCLPPTGRRSTSTSTSSRRRCGRSPASSATAPAKGMRAEASWQHRNFFNPEGRADRSRRCRHPGAARVRRVSPQQFHAPRPGARSPCAGEQRRPRRLSREDAPARAR